MTKVLARLSIPPRLRYEMLLKEGSAYGFDVPHTREGIEFLRSWRESKPQERDDMMKRAYLENVPIHTIRLESITDTGGGEDSEDNSV